MYTAMYTHTRIRTPISIYVYLYVHYVNVHAYVLVCVEMYGEILTCECLYVCCICCQLPFKALEIQKIRPLSHSLAVLYYLGVVWIFWYSIGYQPYSRLVVPWLQVSVHEISSSVISKLCLLCCVCSKTQKFASNSSVKWSATNLLWSSNSRPKVSCMVVISVLRFPASAVSRNNLVPTTAQSAISDRVRKLETLSVRFGSLDWQRSLHDAVQLAALCCELTCLLRSRVVVLLAGACAQLLA